MADGDLITTDMQYEFRQFLFGALTDFQTELVEGVIGMPSTRASDEPRQEDHGDIPGIDTHPGRTINIKMNVLGTGFDVQPKLDACTAVFQSSVRNPFKEYPFITKRPGHDKRFVMARSRRNDFPSNFDTAKGKAKGAAQVFATDPLWYSLEEVETDIAIPTGNFTAQATIPMDGDFEDGSPNVILEITGPTTNPRIQNLDDEGRTLRLDVVVPPGQTLYVNMKTFDVVLNGLTRWDVVRGDNQWWRLMRGDNTIVYNRTGTGDGSTLTVRHHDAWTSA